MSQRPGYGVRCHIGSLVVASTLVTACGAPDPENIDLASVRDEIEALVWTFHAADTAMDAEAVIALLWPDYEMLVDGQRLSFDAVSEGSREYMASLESFNTIWTDLEIIPLSPDFAVSSFAFRDSIVTAAGDVIQSQGPTTLIWARRNAEWRIRFGDADQYPITPTQGAG